MGTLKWNSSGTSYRKSSIRWTAEKAAKATAETIAGEFHLERFKRVHPNEQQAT